MRSLVLIVLFMSLSCPVQALEQKYIERILKTSAYHVKMRVPYIWGKSDCSGVMYDIYFSAGLPVLRSTAYNMSRGLEGWKGVDVSRDNATPADLVFWNVKDYKPSMGKKKKDHPHVGLKTSKSTVGHASGGRGYFLEDPFESAWCRKIELYKRLTIGER